MTAAIPLISCQRHLDPVKVGHKASTFQVFVVRVVQIELHGAMYRVLTDGHHSLAAARLVSVEPTWRGPSRKLQQIMKELGQARFAAMLINNLTDSDWYYVHSGQVVPELLGIERTAA